MLDDGLYHDDGRWLISKLTFGRARVHDGESGRAW